MEQTHTVLAILVERNTTFLSSLHASLTTFTQQSVAREVEPHTHQMCEEKREEEETHTEDTHTHTEDCEDCEHREHNTGTYTHFFSH